MVAITAYANSLALLFKSYTLLLLKALLLVSRYNIVCSLFLTTSQSYVHRSQGLLQLAHDPPGVLQRRVCGGMRHPAADAPERRYGGGAEEVGHQLLTAGGREGIQVEDERQTADQTEDTLIRSNPP